MKNVKIIGIIIFVLVFGVLCSKLISDEAEKQKAEKQNAFEADLKSKGLTVCGICDSLVGRWDETTYYLKNKGFSEDAIDRILSKCQVCAGENMRVLRDSLNRYLAPQGLTVCQIFTDLDRLIDKLFAEAEIKFLNRPLYWDVHIKIMLRSKNLL